MIGCDQPFWRSHLPLRKSSLLYGLAQAYCVYRDNRDIMQYIFVAKNAIDHCSRISQSALMEAIDAEWIKRHLPDERGAQAALARGTGITYDHLSKIMNGNRAVQSHEAPKIYRYFYPDETKPISDPGLRELVGLWSELKPEERDFLRNAAKAQIASRGSSQG